MTRTIVAALAAVLLTCAPAAAQLDTRTIPQASTLTGTERMPAVQGSGCTAKTTPCASVAVTPSLITTFLTPTFQPRDTDLDAIAALTTASFGRSLLTQADAASARSTLGITQQGSTTVQTFTASGTWTKPAGAKTVRVIVKGAGSGGGSGRRGAAATNRTGGSGGAGGGYTEMELSATLLGSSETVTVGIGSAGGAAITADNTNGNGSAAGGNSSFGSWAVARGGNTGQPGSTASGSSSSGGTGLFTGGGGGATTIANGTSPAAATWSGGGSAGGSLTSADAVVTPGVSGAPTASSLTGVGSSQTGTSLGWSSTGGGAGVASTSAAGGNGGDGVLGSGGGGGAASVNGFASGAGGKGGDGVVVVITYY